MSPELAQAVAAFEDLKLSLDRSKALTREQFDALSPRDRMAHMKNGGLVSDAR